MNSVTPMTNCISEEEWAGSYKRPSTSLKE